MNEHPRAQRERLAYIDFAAYFLGRFRRSDVVDRFGVGPAAATRDIALYRDLAPGNLELSTSDKAYRSTPVFSPLFEHQVERVLSALTRGFGEGLSGAGSSIVRSEVPYELAAPSLEVLAPISRAIHLGKAVRLRYYSVTSGQSERTLVPLALASNGARWHTRAFDRKSGEFRDFVLNRIESPEVLEDSVVLPKETAENDIEWGRILELKLVVHPQHPRPEVAARDYPIKDGVLKVRVREAVAGYVMRQWAVDCSPDHSLDAKEFALWLPDSLSLYGSSSARLAPGYVHPHRVVRASGVPA